MNILLIEPRYYTSSVQSYFPIGPAYISAILKQDGHTVHGINTNHIGGSIENALKCVLDRIGEGAFDSVAMGGLCTTFEFQKTLFHRIKHRFPHVICVGGGNLISAEPEWCFREFNVDYGIVGEGEIPARMLYKSIEDHSGIQDIPGLVYSKEGETVENRGTCVHDADQLPIPDWEAFVPKEIIKKTGVMPIFTSRSCPFHCTFCYHPKDSHYRRRSVDHVMDEIEILVGRYGIHHVTVNDELFALDKEWTESFCRSMGSLKNRVTWECQIRVNHADRHVLSMMKNSGCIRVSAGFESGSDAVLKSMKKKITVKESIKGISEIRAGGFLATGGVILGDFAETPETIGETVSFIKEHALIPVSDIGMVVPYPGSAIYQRCLSEGLIVNKEDFLKRLGYFSKLKVNMTAMDDETLLNCQEKASKEVYDWLLKSHSARDVIIEERSGNRTAMNVSCSACGARVSLEVREEGFEVIVPCSSCFYPIMVHPKDLPGLSKRLNDFETFLNTVEHLDRVVLTPSGHDVLRMSALVNIPFDRVIGFLDASPERLAHPFMGKPVFLRNKDELDRLSPETILVISRDYAQEIRRELEPIVQPWQQVIVL